MNTKTYKDLIFWQRAFEVSKMIIKLVNQLPKNQANKIITSQILRSSMSVGANIAEGYGRFGLKEYPRFLQVALGSANETEYWLIILEENHPQFKNLIQEIISRNSESIKMLAASIKSLRSKN